MPETRLKCPSCEAVLKLSAPLGLGKAIKCPKCGAAIRAPAAPGKSGGPVAAARPVPRPQPARKAMPEEEPEDLEDEEEAPRPRKAAQREADEEDEEPLKRKRKKKRDQDEDGSRKKLLWIGIGGGAALIGGGLILVLLLSSGKKGDKQGEGENSGLLTERVSFSLGSGHIMLRASLAVAADGKTLAISFDEKKANVRVFDATTGKQTAEFEDPRRDGAHVALSPDGTLFAISRGHRVELHNLKAGTLVQTLTPDPPGDTGIYQITFSPKGDLLVGESSKRIIGWDVKTGQQKFLWSGHSNFITSVSFFPDGKRLASSSRDGTIRIWDLSRGPTDKILRTPQGWPQGVAISADGKVLVGGEGGGATVDGSIAVWDAETGNLKRRLRETYGGGNVVLSPDGKTVACRSPGGGGITFWDVDSGRARYRWEPKKSGPAAVALTPDGSTLAVVTQDGMVRVWDVKP